MKQVSKDAFDRFIKSYPGKLSSSVTAFFDPPIRHYRDESLHSDSAVGTIEYFLDKEVARISQDIDQKLRKYYLND